MHDSIDLYALLAFNTHQRDFEHAPFFAEVIMISYNKKDLERTIEDDVEEDPDLFNRENYKIIRIELGKEIEYGYDEFLQEQEEKKVKLKSDD